MRLGLVTWTAAFWAAVPPLAQEPFLTLPLDCELGKTCYIEDYVDVDPGEGVRDFACGLKTRNGHRGTDFALVSQADFTRGIHVIASAPGLVEATRDGMADVPYTAETAAAIKGRECGNAVRVRHANGLQTLYCHLAQGSVRVNKGDTVGRGDVLGTVGMSGQSNYPHVHVSVLGPDGNIDPFDPKGGEECGVGAQPLWQAPLPYSSTGMFTAGFSDRVPSFDDVKSGAARVSETGRDAPLVLYSHFYYAQDGDVLHLTASGPDGEVFDKHEQLEAPKVNQYRAYGRKAPNGGWPTGEYSGRAVLERGGEVLAVRFTRVTIP
ncbi:MAG: M23 family metallopeptidase [Paracoccaceae bacterium]